MDHYYGKSIIIIMCRFCNLYLWLLSKFYGFLINMTCRRWAFGILNHEEEVEIFKCVNFYLIKILGVVFHWYIKIYKIVSLPYVTIFLIFVLSSHPISHQISRFFTRFPDNLNELMFKIIQRGNNIFISCRCTWRIFCLTNAFKSFSSECV